MLTEITYHHDWDDERIADWLHGRISAALAMREGPVAVSVPGGSTPFPILENLALMDLRWERLEFWPGDDRCVHPDHEASNLGRLRNALAATDAQVIPLEEDSQPPHFALVWLGMGTDGHIASLFENTNPLPDDEQMVRRITPDPLPQDAPFDRITMTLPKFLAAEELMFVIRGETKQQLFQEAVRGQNDLPVARLLHNARASITCFTG
ncbi:6-phosphogluconolactonase [Croceicoccus sp. F390]|uniref:6-phosphogluconolactonase n=1 Tax=Croceicoccus esteveae TaxID=3075597 RepID=A0ABU2ZGV4_9SPHN|nr:6-phosphogluconolactonase [Croceicoccus sp. F390]MDT0574829.1 6-phosphogluconolactonase [Croceicoccus sp. F390]